MSIHSSLIFRILVPKFIRKKLFESYLKRSIDEYYSIHQDEQSDEITEALSYLKNNPIAVFPYPFQDQYHQNDIKVHKDHVKGLHYVMLDGKKLYFKRRWSIKRIQHSFNELTKEQDLQSPHRYLTNDFDIEEGEVLVDIGVAEGNFALAAVEKAARLILFETDKEWIEALNATFEPWKDKVLIINKFVSDIDNGSNVTLDHFLKPNEKISFLKIDVDGAEAQLLKGCKRILSEMKPLKLAICTYHKQNDEMDFTAILEKNGFITSTSNRFILFYYDKQIAPPYFRKGLIRAVK